MPEPTSNLPIQTELYTEMVTQVRAGRRLFRLATADNLTAMVTIREVASHFDMDVVEFDFDNGWRGAVDPAEVKRVARSLVPPAEDLLKNNALNVLRAIPEFREPAAAIFVVNNYHEAIAAPAPGGTQIRQTLLNMDDGRLMRQLDVNAAPCDKLVVFLSTADATFHPAVCGSMVELTLNLPNEDQLGSGPVAAACLLLSEAGRPVPDAPTQRELARTCLGLSQPDAANALAVAAITRGNLGREAMADLRRIKAKLLRKSRALIPIPDEQLVDPEHLVGMDDLLEEIRLASLAYSEAGLEAKLPPPRGIVAAGIPGSGKCLGRGTPVLMYDGTVKPVEEIVEGDLLMGPDSHPRRVRDLCHGHGPLFRIIPNRGEPYVVNENHVLSLCHTGTKAIRGIPVTEYLQSTHSSRSHWKGWRVRVDWPARDVPITPYIAGLIVVHGNTTPLTITTTDQGFVASLRRFSSAMQWPHKVTLRGKHTVTYEFVDEQGKSVLHIDDADGTRIPQSYLINSVHSRMALLAGIVDSVGRLSRDKATFEIPAVHPDLARDVIFLARSLGLSSYIRTRQTEGTDGFVQVIVGGQISDIPTRSNRKQVLCRRLKKNVLRTGIKVEPIGEGEFFGFELDGDHLFLLGDFTVTHNSSVALSVPKIFQTHAARNLPIVRFDVGSLFSKYVGESESIWRQTRDVLTAQRHSGVVVIFDEGGRAISGIANSTGQTDSGVGGRIFADMLTFFEDAAQQGWLIYPFFTMNDPTMLPPEFLARVDATYFFDLPDAATRAEIFKVHLNRELKCRYGLDRSALGWPNQHYDILADETPNFVGRDIVKVIGKAFRATFDLTRSGPVLPDFDILRAQIKAQANSIQAVTDSARIDQLRQICAHYRKISQRSPERDTKLSTDAQPARRLRFGKGSNN